MGLHQIKSFCIAKETFSKTKRETTKSDKIFANYKSAKGLISQIYKELTQINIKKKKKKLQSNYKKSRPK